MKNDEINKLAAEFRNNISDFKSHQVKRLVGLYSFQL